MTHVAHLKEYKEIFKYICKPNSCLPSQCESGAPNSLAVHSKMLFSLIGKASIPYKKKFYGKRVYTSNTTNLRKIKHYKAISCVHVSESVCA